MSKRKGVRHLQAMLLWLCLATNYMHQGNAPIAVIIMMEQLEEKEENECLSRRINGPFFYFFPLTTILSGYLGTAINNKYYLLFNGLSGTLLSYSTPYFFKAYGWNALFIIRLTQGLTQGLVLPQIYGQLVRWIPPDEFVYLGPITVSGTFAGTFFINFMGGFLGELKGGWESIFYLSGHCSLLWCFAFAGLGAQEPETCWYISTEERAYLYLSLASRGKTSFRRRVPWRSVLTNIPSYAIIVSHAVHNWGFQTLVRMGPVIMHMDFKLAFPMVGLMAGLPFLMPILTIFPFAYLANFLLFKKIINLETLRFTANSIGQFGMGISLLFMAFSDQLGSAFVFYCTAFILGSCQLMGIYMNHFDLAPNFGIFLFGWTAGLAHISSILGPYISSYIYYSYEDIAGSGILFICGINYILGNLIYIMFGSVDVQSFNTAQDSQEFMRRR